VSPDGNLDFTGRTVVVTGAAHGFGRAISIAFAARGATVWACDVLADELAEGLGQELFLGLAALQFRHGRRSRRHAQKQGERQAQKPEPATDDGMRGRHGDGGLRSSVQDDGLRPRNRTPSEGRTGAGRR